MSLHMFKPQSENFEDQPRQENPFSKPLSQEELQAKMAEFWEEQYLEKEKRTLYDLAQNVKVYGLAFLTLNLPPDRYNDVMTTVFRCDVICKDVKTLEDIKEARHLLYTLYSEMHILNHKQSEIISINGGLAEICKRLNIKYTSELRDHKHDEAIKRCFEEMTSEINQEVREMLKSEKFKPVDSAAAQVMDELLDEFEKEFGKIEDKPKKKEVKEEVKDWRSLLSEEEE